MERTSDRLSTANPPASETRAPEKGIGLGPLAGYFLKLGTVGFGGPVALVGFMHRDLVEQRRWITEETYKLSLALAQIMPGPLAAQVAIAIGYFEGGVLGATLSGLAFVLPSFLMVVGISLAYVAYGGLWWMQALFYAIGATVIAIIVIAAYKLARSTNKRDPLLWAIFVMLTAVTLWAQAELAEFFILAGLIVLFARAWPGWKRGLLIGARRHRVGIDDMAVRSLGATNSDGSGFPRCAGADSGVFHQSRGFRIWQRLGDHPIFAARSGPTIRLVERTSVLGRGRGCDDYSRSRGHHGRLHRLFWLPGSLEPFWHPSGFFYPSTCLQSFPRPGSNVIVTILSSKPSSTAPPPRLPAPSPAQFSCWAAARSWMFLRQSSGSQAWRSSGASNYRSRFW